MEPFAAQQMTESHWKWLKWLSWKQRPRKLSPWKLRVVLFSHFCHFSCIGYVFLITKLKKDRHITWSAYWSSRGVPPTPPCTVNEWTTRTNINFTRTCRVFRAKLHDSYKVHLINQFSREIYTMLKRTFLEKSLLFHFNSNLSEEKFAFPKIYFSSHVLGGRFLFRSKIW